MFEIQVSEEDNRNWHIKNIEDAVENLQRVWSENDQREQDAIMYLNESIEWAKQDYPELLKDFND